MNRAFRFIVVLTYMALVVPGVTQAQVLDNINVSNSCSYLGEELPTEVFTFESDQDAEDVIRRIVDISGLTQNFSIYAAGVPNAAATIRGAERVILYNQSFMRNTRDRTGSAWGPFSIMAHEVGHHLNGHTLIPGGSRPSTELQADRFSGHVMHRLGASLGEALVTMNVIGSERGSATHPAKRDRLAAITNGWLAACDQDPTCDSRNNGELVEIPGDIGIPGDSCRWANDGECDEPDLCAPGTDTADCRDSGNLARRNSSCRWANDGECDEPDLCAPGTDAADCRDSGNLARRNNSCRWANDGECDEPDLCAPGTDAADCRDSGNLTRRNNSCRWTNDGECDEPDLCAPGTDTGDCRGRGRGRGNTADLANSCLRANDGECDERDLCEAGTDTADCLYNRMPWRFDA